MHKFFNPPCDPVKHEFIEIDTDSLYIAINSEDLDDIVPPQMKHVWSWMRASDCTVNFEATSGSNFFPRKYCTTHDAFDQRTPGLLKEEF